jgi:hypothetical protein
MMKPNLVEKYFPKESWIFGFHREGAATSQPRAKRSGAGRSRTAAKSLLSS